MQDKCTHDVSREINAVLHSVEDDVYLTTEVFSDILDCSEWARVSISFVILKSSHSISSSSTFQFAVPPQED